MIVSSLRLALGVAGDAADRGRFPVRTLSGAGGIFRLKAGCRGADARIRFNRTTHTELSGSIVIVCMLPAKPVLNPQVPG